MSFETVRQVRECFDVYGDKMSFEWEPTVDEGHTIFTGIDDFTKFTAPDTAELLPKRFKSIRCVQLLKIQISRPLYKEAGMEVLILIFAMNL